MFTNNMGLKLKSQVLQDGLIYLIGIDRFGRECLRLRIDRRGLQKSNNKDDKGPDDRVDSTSDVTSVSQIFTPS